MNKYLLHVSLEVEVDAFDLADAIDAVQDAFGEGSTCGVNINKFKVDEQPKQNRK